MMCSAFGSLCPASLIIAAWLSLISFRPIVCAAESDDPKDYASATVWPKSKPGERAVYELVARNFHPTKAIRLSVHVIWRESGRECKQTKTVILKPQERRTIGGYSEGDGKSGYRAEEGHAEFQ